MIMIWQRYFLKRALIVCFGFLFGFFGLYVAVDYSTHASMFRHSPVDSRLLFAIQYYLCEFLDHLPILLPFALLISTIYTVTTLNTHRELVALLASGIPLKKLLRPFLWVGLISTLFLYFNEETLRPFALNQLKNFKEARHRLEKRERKLPLAQHLTLGDNSRLFYLSYDRISNTFDQAYWILSPDEVYRIQKLAPPPELVGYFVDHLKRNEKGILEVTASHEQMHLTAMQFPRKLLEEAITLPEEMPLSQLASQKKDLVLTEREARIATNFWYKLVMPWIAFFAVLGPLPFCVKFSRTFSIFIIYAAGIFSLVALYLLMDAGLILGERQGLTPEQAILAPFGFFALLMSINYARLK